MFSELHFGHLTCTIVLTVHREIKLSLILNLHINLRNILDNNVIKLLIFVVGIFKLVNLDLRRSFELILVLF